MTSAAGFTKGLHELGNGHYAYLQPDGSWGGPIDTSYADFAARYLQGAKP